MTPMTPAGVVRFGVAGKFLGYTGIVAGGAGS